MGAPKKIYIDDFGTELSFDWHTEHSYESDIEYVRKDVFIESVINFLNYKLDDVIAIRVPGTIIPHHVSKQELIGDLKKYMKRG